jgi:hypothetical protein
MTASRPFKPPVALPACLVALILWPCALPASSIAALRGQKTVDPSILPLVCIEIGTVGTPLVLDSLVFENLETQVEEKRTLANTFSKSRPDILTAAAPGPISLSLPILRFRPGRYRLKSITFVGPGDGYTLDLSASGAWFEVKPACVNYVGGIEIDADWAYLFKMANRRMDHNQVSRVSARSRVIYKNTVQRDVRWACEQIPGMVMLSSMVSSIAVK